MKVTRYGLKCPRGFLSCTETETYSNFSDDAIYFVDLDSCIRFFKATKEFLSEPVSITEFQISFPRLLSYRIF